jgi:hypothetical protein
MSASSVPCGFACYLYAVSDWSYHTPLQISDMAPPNAPVVPNVTAPGVFVRGTLRMPREGLFDIVNANLKQSFGGWDEPDHCPDLCRYHLQLHMHWRVRRCNCAEGRAI